MTDTFDPGIPPQSGPTGVITARGSLVRFGDGYEALYSDGFNDKVQSWPMTWVGTDAEIDPIREFLDAHVNVSFFWVPPNGEEGRYSYRVYNYIPEAAGNAKLNVTLDQVFRP